MSFSALCAGGIQSVFVDISHFLVAIVFSQSTIIALIGSIKQ